RPTGSLPIVPKQHARPVAERPLVLRPTAVVELVWQDESGSTAVTLLRVPSSSTVEQADVSATALASVLLPLTGAVLVRQRIRYQRSFEVPPPADNSTAIVRAGGFWFDCEGDTPDAIIVVPAITESVILTNEPMAGVGIDPQND